MNESNEKLILSMPIYNRLKMTQSCIEMIQRHTEGDWELVVWDNASSDEEVKKYFDELCQTDPRIHYHQNDVNLGFIIPNNRVFEENKNRCKYFGVLNNDIIISETGWNTRLISELEKNDRIAEVGNIQKFGHLDDRMWGTCRKEKYIDYIEGACFIVKTEVVRDNLPSLFDEKYLSFGYWEDSDLSLRLKVLGYEIKEVNVGVKHIGAQTLRNEKLPSEVQTYLNKNHEPFVDRWGIYVKEKRKMKILVIRSGANGDVLLTYPVLKALSYKYPASEIYVQTNCMQMLERCDLPLVEIGRELKGERTYDKVIDLDLAYEKRPLIHIVDAYADEAEVVVDSKIPVYDPLIKWHGEESKIVLVNTDPSWNSRAWDKNRWRKVFSDIKAQGYRIIEIGTVSYLGIGENFLRRPLKEIAELMAVSFLYLGIDNMLMHLAQSIGLPVVALFGCICPNYRITDWDNVRAIWLDQNQLECAGCHHLRNSPRVLTNCDKDRVYCLEGISEEMVLNAFENGKPHCVPKPLKEGIGIKYHFVKPRNLPLPVEVQRLSQAQKDLEILRLANMIRRSPERFKAAKAIAGSSFVG